MLPVGKAGLELLRLVATACGGVSLFPQLPFPLQLLCAMPTADSRLKLSWHSILSPPVRFKIEVFGGSGICIDRGGVVRSLTREEFCFVSCSIPRHRAKTGIGNSWLLLLGRPSQNTMKDRSFDFTDPFFTSHFRSLFLDHTPPLTDPVEFLGHNPLPGSQV